MKSISVRKWFARSTVAFAFASLALSLLGARSCLANESWAVAYMGTTTAGPHASDTTQAGMGHGPILSGQTDIPGHPGQMILPGKTNDLSSPAAGQAPTLPPLGAVPPHNYRVAPYAGHAVHSQRPSTFRWGWFGAEHFYPQVRWHENYQGELVRWTSQRRY